MNIIPVARFEVCEICGATRYTLMSAFRGRANGAYYIDKFARHLQSHGMALKAYCISFLNIAWLYCPVTNEEVGYKVTGEGVILHTYKRFAGVTKAMSPKVRAAAERASQERRGKGNPAYGKEAWNRNLPAGHPYFEKMAAKRRGIREGPETKQKHRENRRKHPLKARHTTPHTPQTKKQISMNTAAMHHNHSFGRESSVHIAMREALSSLCVEFTEEHPAESYSIDFALPAVNLAIEADGDFFHTNPALYPDGPTCAIQRHTVRNDRAKNAYLAREGWTLLRYWENDILSPGFRERLRCDLVRLSVLGA